GLLLPGGEVVLAETDAARAQRLSELIDWRDAPSLGERVAASEASLYAGALAWSEERWQELARVSGLTLASHHDVVVHGEQPIALASIERWFGSQGARGPYADALSATLDDDEVREVERR